MTLDKVLNLQWLGLLKCNLPHRVVVKIKCLENVYNSVWHIGIIFECELLLFEYSMPPTEPCSVPEKMKQGREKPALNPDSELALPTHTRNSCQDLGL